MRKVGVAGAGAMGAGIAQLLAQSGFDTLLFDVSSAVLAKAQRRIAVGLKRSKKGESLALLKTTRALEDLAGCDLAIEAIPEDLALKRELFEKLGALLPFPAILATNTSSLSVSEIAQAAKDPARVAGLHFFNPPTIMRLVEVVRADKTSEETVSRLLALVLNLGKTAAPCRDTPGFIVNRVACPFFQAAAGLLESGAGTPESIDRALKDAGFPMGPFELADLIGLDVSLSVQRSLYEALGRPERLKPSPGAAALAARGCLGRKTSGGFYVDGAANPLLGEVFPDLGARPLPAGDIVAQVLACVNNEARLAAAEAVASARDIETAMSLGMNWPKSALSIQV